MVNEISSLRITIIGLFGLVSFIILGILRVTSLENVSFQFGLEKIADAFQKRAEELFGNSKN